MSLPGPVNLCQHPQTRLGMSATPAGIVVSIECMTCMEKIPATIHPPQATELGVRLIQTAAAMRPAPVNQG